MSLGKFLFQTVTYFVSLTLTFVHIVTQCFFTFAVASLTSAVYHRQRALNMVIAEFHTTFALIRHVTICTRHTSLTVNTHLTDFIIRMLRFQYRSTAQFMNIVIETFIIIISLHIFHSKAFIPGESQVLTITLEVVLHVTLRTNQRTHFLRSSFRNISALACKSLDQCRTADVQVHIFRFVAIGTSDRIYDLIAHCSPLIIIECIHTDSLHHTGNIRTLTSPAGRRLRTIFGSSRRTCTKTSRNILYRMHMATRSRIIL